MQNNTKNRIMLPQQVINLNNQPIVKTPRNNNKLELKLPTVNSATLPTVVRRNSNVGNSMINKTFFQQNKEGWDILFTKAKDAKTIADKEEFNRFITNDVANKLPCGSCSQHTKSYLAAHDIREYYYITEVIDGVPRDIGLFKYVWEFKNAVNKRINKPQINLVEAVRLYY